ncbi:hypothetical protein EHF33_07320 [Deinococcus psychrotolerans]|uniref:Uncharacterized protein n=1 Tax=Deinococcus psychrotolerans TaxID=2489213 RepID=A0A3G8YBA0_9DEIO|nr:hypothetical protein [Deinococcus psychrotolerans]AZI42578.1 hypothetical protein EHF33_07320 [Deinococcus psychrotolerans]
MAHKLTHKLLSRRELNFPVKIAEEEGRFSACWRDGTVESTCLSGSHIYKITEVALLEPSLIPALTVLIRAICPDQIAEAMIKSMVKANDRECRGIRVKNGANYRNRRGRRVKNGILRDTRQKNSSFGMIYIEIEMGGMKINGATIDGQEYLISGRRVSFTTFAASFPDLLADFVLAVRKFVKNPIGFQQAVCESYPEIAKHHYFQETKKVPETKKEREIHPDYMWVADALASQRQSSKQEFPSSRTLNNRVRHVR